MPHSSLALQHCHAVTPRGGWERYCMPPQEWGRRGPACSTGDCLFLRQGPPPGTALVTVNLPLVALQPPPVTLQPSVILQLSSEGLADVEQCFFFFGLLWTTLESHQRGSHRYAGSPPPEGVPVLGQYRHLADGRCRDAGPLGLCAQYTPHHCTSVAALWGCVAVKGLHTLVALQVCPPCRAVLYQQDLLSFSRSPAPSGQPSVLKVPVGGQPPTAG